MTREQGRKLVAQNKKARHDYYIEDAYEAGLVLTGTEVKSLRAGRASLVDGFATIKDGEAWLHNVHIPEYTAGDLEQPRAAARSASCCSRKELQRLIGKTKESGLTIVPLALYFKDGYAKVEIALARARSRTTSAMRWPSATPTVSWRGPWVDARRAWSEMAAPAALVGARILGRTPRGHHPGGGAR